MVCIIETEASVRVAWREVAYLQMCIDLVDSIALHV